MIYWVSASGPAASLHIYYECFGQIQNSTLLTDYVSVPFGMSQFPKEMVPMPPSYVTLYYAPRPSYPQAVRTAHEKVI
jgi:hypothetical protein